MRSLSDQSSEKPRRGTLENKCIPIIREFRLLVNPLFETEKLVTSDTLCPLVSRIPLI